MAPEEILQDGSLQKASAIELPDKGVQSLIQELVSIDTEDQESIKTRTAVLKLLAEQCAFPSLEPLLPLVLNLNGRPYSIQDHYPFGQLA